MSGKSYLGCPECGDEIDITNDLRGNVKQFECPNCKEIILAEDIFVNYETLSDEEMPPPAKRLPLDKRNAGAESNAGVTQIPHTGIGGGRGVRTDEVKE